MYRNNRRGGFEDISEQVGAGDVGWCHALSHLDSNNDGWQDLYLANDFGEDVLLENQGGKRFVNATPQALQQKFYHGMGVGLTDFNQDGREDIYVTNIAMFSFVTKLIKPGKNTRITVTRATTENLRMIEANLFLVSASDTYLERNHHFFDRRPGGCGWAWDADFFDFDNDGIEDLYVVNGREPNVGYDRERNVLFKQSGGHFYDVSTDSGADYKSNARGAAYADFDKDGDLDIVINNYHDQSVVLRNNLQRNNWVRFRLEGTNSNRDAVGARVKLFTDAGTQMRTVRGGSGFLSKDPCAVHFGLNQSNNINKVEITWPSGLRQELSSVDINQEHHIIEPNPLDSTG